LNSNVCTGAAQFRRLEFNFRLSSEAAQFELKFNSGEIEKAGEGKRKEIKKDGETEREKEKNGRRK